MNTQYVQGLPTRQGMDSIIDNDAPTEVFDYEKHTGFSKPVWEIDDLEVKI